MSNRDSERLRSALPQRVGTKRRNEELGRGLREALEESGLPKSELAELLGVARSDIEHWIRGEHHTPALLAFDERLPAHFRERLQAKWAVPTKSPLVRDERAVLVTVLEASSALAKHLLATSQPANDNAGPPPVRQIAQAHDVLADYLRARAA